MPAEEKEKKCNHPPSKYFAWWAFNYKTGKNDILCIGCTACGDVIQGAADEEVSAKPWQPKVK